MWANRLLGKNSLNCYKAVLDSNIIYSAFFYEGLEADLLEYCSSGEIKGFVSEYIVSELRRILVSENLELDNFLKDNKIGVIPNSHYKQDMRYKEYVKESKFLDDVDDRPIYLFAKVFLKRNPSAFFVTGDKDFNKVRDKLFGRVMTTRQFLSFISRSENKPE